MSFAFVLNAEVCTGCKACQAACKDKNDLPVGVIWRRVIEVSGGGWHPQQNAWINDVFAYNLSLACNHCVHPKCAGVCPTNAYEVRADGIVLLDGTKCIGCGYCNWACPYAVPQYNQLSGKMSKCDLCADLIDQGIQPACISACPMRALELVEANEQTEISKAISLWNVDGSGHPFPLPEFSRTQPHLALIPHPAMLNDLPKKVSNLEEIRPRKPKSEIPLVIFTLLVQMAVGMIWTEAWISNVIFAQNQSGPSLLKMIPTLTVGLMLAIATLISFLHLGTRSNAWRAISNLKKSALSREILNLGLLGLFWLASILFRQFDFRLVLSLLGFTLLYNMANIYRLRSMPSWNSWRTFAAFLSSALVLGIFFQILLVTTFSALTGQILPSAFFDWWFVLILAVLTGSLILNLFNPTQNKSKNRIRTGLLLFLILVLVAMNLWIRQGVILLIISLLIEFGLLVEEVLGRWLFYEELKYRRL